jgi:intracellular septation protein
MKYLFDAGKLLLLDMASTFFFLVVFLLTRNVALSVVLGMALGVAQIGWQLFKGKPVEALQWLSLVLILASGTATFFTHDPRFVMLKPSAIYCIVGVVMLKRGWMNRYLPPRAAPVADVATTFGYVWAGLMFASAVLNIALALTLDAKSWAAAMSAWGIASKIGLFLVQYAVMTMIGRRRATAATASI